MKLQIPPLVKITRQEITMQKNHFALKAKPLARQTNQVIFVAKWIIRVVSEVQVAQVSIIKIAGSVWLHLLRVGYKSSQ